MLDYDNIPIGTKVYWFLTNKINEGIIIGRSIDFYTFNHYIIQFKGYKITEPLIVFNGYEYEINGQKYISEGYIFFDKNKCIKNYRINKFKELKHLIASFWIKL